jgi:cytochrome c-type biogenesis protein CcmH
MLLAAAVLALALAAPAAASEKHPTLAELEGEVICPTCHTTLDMSSSPIAARMRVYIRRWIAEGDTKSEIERKLVAQFGEGVLAAPPKRGFGLLAWLLPVLGVLAGGAALGVGAWRRSAGRERARPAPAGPPLDPELERRLDDELRRFDG